MFLMLCSSSSKKKKSANTEVSYVKREIHLRLVSHICLLGLVFLGVCSVEWLRLGQVTSSELVCDLLFWAEGS